VVEQHGRPGQGDAVDRRQPVAQAGGQNPGHQHADLHDGHADGVANGKHEASELRLCRGEGVVQRNFSGPTKRLQRQTRRGVLTTKYEQKTGVLDLAEQASDPVVATWQGVWCDANWIAHELHE